MGIVAVEVAHLVVAVGDGGFERAVEGVPVEVLIAAALREEGKVAVVEAQIGVGRFAQILVVGFAQGQTCHTAARIDHVEVHAVLVAVEGDDGQTVRVGGGGDAGDVAIGIEGHIEAARGAALEVVTMETDAAVGFSGDGVFVVVGAGVGIIFCVFRFQSFEHLHPIDRHFRFVIAHPAEHPTVGRESKGAGGGEFLLVDPVGDAVEDFVAASVGGYLHFGIAIEEFYHEKVVVAGKGDDVAIGREEGRHLRSALGEAFHLARGHIVEVIDSGEGAAIDGAGFGLEKYPLLVGAHDVAVDARDFGGGACLVQVEEDADFLSRLEGRAHNAPPVVGEAGVAFAVVERMHAVEMLR